VHAEFSLARFHAPIWSPVVGAVLLGFDRQGPISDEVYMRLESELDSVANRYSKTFRVR